MMALKWAAAERSAHACCQGAAGFFAAPSIQATEIPIADNAHPPLTGYFFPGVFLEFPYANRDRSFFARGGTPG